MFETSKESFFIDRTRPQAPRNFPIRWGAGCIIAALEFQAICTLILELPYHGKFENQDCSSVILS
jgi:hypothetical protein